MGKWYNKIKSYIITLWITILSFFSKVAGQYDNMNAQDIYWVPQTIKISIYIKILRWCTIWIIFIIWIVNLLKIKKTDDKNLKKKKIKKTITIMSILVILIIVSLITWYLLKNR